MFVAAFHNGLKAGHFNESLAQKPATSMQEVTKRAECYIKGEESNAEKRSRDAKEKEGRNINNRASGSQVHRSWTTNEGHRQGHRNKPYYPPSRQGGSTHPQERRYPPERSYTPLNRAKVNVLDEILQTGLVHLPPPRFKNSSMGQDANAWHAYHRCKGHDTESCFKLRDLIEDLIKSGHLRKFLEDA
ncbi:gag-pol polyprotein, partial [Trifolium medium]|nr:gag-pol polyprotein [Trifolium medium]